MTTTKVALSIRQEVPAAAKKEVARHRSKSLSAFVSDALDEKLTRAELESFLDEMDALHGKPGKAAEAWAKRALRPTRAYWM
ncbi:MAG: hypothetical protein R3B13_07475 [Polyangiaceae bacterium]